MLLRVIHFYLFRSIEHAKVQRIFEMCKYKEQNFQNYSKLFFLRVLFIGSEYIRVMVEQYELARYK